jgi:hypothetical protein
VHDVLSDEQFADGGEANYFVHPIPTKVEFTRPRVFSD